MDGWNDKHNQMTHSWQKKKKFGNYCNVMHEKLIFPWLTCWPTKSMFFVHKQLELYPHRFLELLSHNIFVISNSIIAGWNGVKSRYYVFSFYFHFIYILYLIYVFKTISSHCEIRVRFKWTVQFKLIIVIFIQ